MIAASMSSDAARAVRFRVVYLNPPDDDVSDFGLQDRDGELAPGKRTRDGSIRYECEATARSGGQGSVRFSGSYVHGPTGDQFLYISFRPPDGASSAAPWVRRLKIPLVAVDWDLVGAAENGVLEAEIHDVGRARAELAASWTPSR